MTMHRWVDYGYRKTLQVFQQECVGLDADGVPHYTNRGDWVDVLSIYLNDHIAMHGEVVVEADAEKEGK